MNKKKSISASPPKGKSFKKYLLEGLMIFIAIVLGFISENIRSDLAEKKMTREFALSMISDLQSDTTNLKYTMSYFRQANKNIDSLNTLLLKNNFNNIPSGKLYFYGLWGGANEHYVSNDATFQQMRNSGLLRDVKNKSLLKKILNYDRLNREYQQEMALDNLFQIEVRKLRGQIFDYKYNRVSNTILQHSKRSNNQQEIDAFLQSDPPLLTYDPVVFNQYMEMVRSRKFEITVIDLERLLKNAEELISALKKEYE
ncbi:hypothetical protein [Gaetbulibacter aestuarii]|uniref:Uncharacterized protein n=1 Tax=Gaetbulibacter aestuarii TaxID=1502358 RepID=A0ABW7MX85_9FLAO